MYKEKKQKQTILFISALLTIFITQPIIHLMKLNLSVYPEWYFNTLKFAGIFGVFLITGIGIHETEKKHGIVFKLSNYGMK